MGLVGKLPDDWQIGNRNFLWIIMKISYTPKASEFAAVIVLVTVGGDGCDENVSEDSESR